MRRSKPSASSSSQSRKKIKTSSRKRPQSHPSFSSAGVTSNSLSPEDIPVLDVFCASVEFVEIPVVEWEHGFNQLNITVPIWIAKGRADQGCDHAIEFVRTLRKTPGDQAYREKARVNVQIPQESHEGAQILVPGLGDVSGGKAGDLIVIIHIKS